MSNFVVKNGLVVNGSFTANSTNVNAASIAAVNVTAGNTTTTGQTIVAASGTNSGITATSNTGAAITSTSNTGYGIYVSSNSGPVAWFGQTSGITLNYLYIAANGNIGLGTTSPGYNLDVSANARIVGSLIATGGINANGSLGSPGQYMASNGAGIYWTDAGFANGSNISVGKITASESSNTSAGGYSFTQDSSQDTGMFSSGDGILNFYNNATQTLTILATGNVGISNTAPDATLHVQGTANISGALIGGSTIADSAGNIRSLPINGKSSAYQLAATDNGLIISITTGGVTVNGSILSSGFATSIFNNSGSNQTITSGTGATMYLGGSATTGNRTLAQYGIATVVCVAANTFVITGAGLT